MRGDHHRGAGAERHLDARHRGADARVLGDAAGVVLRHVEIGADEDAALRRLAGGDEICETEDVHSRGRRGSRILRLLPHRHRFHPVLPLGTFHPLSGRAFARRPSEIATCRPCFCSRPCAGTSASPSASPA
jgi:hypothetical protein